MEPIRFADILFTAITLLIVYLILYRVHKSKQENKPSEQSDAALHPDTEDTDNIIPGEPPE